MEFVYCCLPVGVSDGVGDTEDVVLSQSHHISFVVLLSQKQHRIGIFTVFPEYLLK